MNKLIFSAMLLLLASLTYTQVVQSQINSCSSECGGNTSFDCTDFDKTTSDPNNCKSCAPGNIGGSPAGSLCRKGKAAPGCGASVNSTDSSKCYVCVVGYYDPVGDTRIATPCSACHQTCGSCRGPGPNDCLTCVDGTFDATANPYIPGSCDPCDSRCTSCSLTATNCKGCCALGFTPDVNGYCKSG